MTDSKDTVIVATTGYTGRELFAINDRENHLYMVGSMGCASSLALGISLARPELKVVVIDGDGAALMRMGNMATIGTYAGRNFVHLLLDNEAHESTGGQSTVSANVNFAAIAKACNYPLAYYGNDPGILTSLLDDHDHTGPRFAQIKIRQGSMQNLPRPALSPADAVRRLMAHLGTAF
jgi:phosphonopyruvate decarboxylase